MKRTFALLMLSPFSALILGAYAVHAHWSTYPSVAQLQAALNAYPGAQIPAKEVVMNGHVWTAYYVEARAIGGGRYSVIIQLR